MSDRPSDARDGDASDVTSEDDAADSSGGDPCGAKDVGPDPVWGLGVFVIGLLVMAVGGANTWHYVFNVGEGLLLLGAFVFLVSVAITSHKKDPIDWRAAMRGVLRGDDDE